MRLNALKPARGSKSTRTRVGRGIGSGLGKTCGRGHKGEQARKSGNAPAGFEGGQMPIHRRLPKFGFRSLKAAATAAVRLGSLNRVSESPIDLMVLKSAGLVPSATRRVKVYASGVLTRPVVLRGLALTPGARAALEAAGGKAEE
jgi:large subunit ribosomal protein L15